jgi:hypothetical protein
MVPHPLQAARRSLEATFSSKSSALRVTSDARPTIARAFRDAAGEWPIWWELNVLIVQ